MRPDPPAPDVVAQIGQQPVRYAQLEEHLKRTVGDSDSVLASDVLSQLFDQYLDEEILYRLAIDRGLVAGADPSRRVAIDALLAEASEAEPSEAEVAAYYDLHRAEFDRPERVQLRQILTEDRAAAERALAEIKDGTDFGEVARSLSRDPSASSGGLQGELARGDLPPAFADEIFRLSAGEVSRIVAADYGFHIFQVTERFAAEVVPLAKARAEIVAQLRRQRGDRRLAELVQEGRNRYNVEVFSRNLPFDYRGSYSDGNDESKQ
jgi:parvulin-like peptidyl-prolyl isomerase